MAYACAVEENSIENKSFNNANNESQCVELVKQICGAPATAGWRKGVNVMEADAGTIQKFVGIATFDQNGRYHGHAAVYISHSEKGIDVYDQWKDKPTGRRTIRARKFAGTHARLQNIAENYFVIEPVK